MSAQKKYITGICVVIVLSVTAWFAFGQVLAPLRQPQLTNIAAQIDSADLRAVIDSVYGVRHRTLPGSMERVKAYMRQQFEVYGVQPELRAFDFEGYEAHNIIGRIEGKKERNKTFVICAHYDTSADSPGADDNGSGLAVMLDVMKVLSKYSFDYSIEFVAFDVEEDGSEGSQRYLAELPNDIELLGTINLDMVGSYSDKPGSQTIPDNVEEFYPEVYEELIDDGSRANFVLNISTKQSVELEHAFNNAARVYVPELKVITMVADRHGEIIPALARSDNASFWSFGFSALHIGETGEMRNPAIHTTGDDRSNLNYKFMANVAKATAVTIATLATIQQDVQPNVAAK